MCHAKGCHVNYNVRPTREIRSTSLAYPRASLLARTRRSLDAQRHPDCALRGIVTVVLRVKHLEDLRPFRTVALVRRHSLNATKAAPAPAMILVWHLRDLIVDQSHGMRTAEDGKPTFHAPGLRGTSQQRHTPCIFGVSRSQSQKACTRQRPPISFQYHPHFRGKCARCETIPPV